MNDINVKQLAEIIVERVEDDFDMVVIISGDPGNGKTTIGIELAQEIYNIKNKVFDLKKSLIFTQLQLFKWLKEHENEPQSVAILDEAINISYNRDGMSSNSRAINKIFDMVRGGRNHIFLFLLPNFKSVDIHIRNRAKAWVYCERRKFAYLFVAEKNPAVLDKWNLAYLEKIWVEKQIQKYIPFRANIHFDKLTPEIENEYKIIKESSRALIEEKAEEETTKELLINNKPVCQRCRSVSIVYRQRPKNYLCRRCGLVMEEAVINKLYANQN